MFYEFTDPFRMMDNTLRQVDRALRFGRNTESADLVVYDVGEHFALIGDLPGFEEKDIELTIEGDVLTLRAERPRDKREGWKLVRAERPALKISRQIELPARVDASAVVATLKDGVLRVTLPKAAEARPKRIAIQTTKKLEAATA
ncbi:MAG: Hsp20/alpha crystallin family protein [Polyangiaceae bacterium]